MKEKIVAKLDEHIERLLEKPELTGEEYAILRENGMGAEDGRADQADVYIPGRWRLCAVTTQTPAGCAKT